MSRRLLWLSLPFKQPYITATGTAKARDMVLLRVEEANGVVGCGEAAPFEPYDGISVGDVARVLRERLTPVGYPQVHAADEMAFLDLEGQRTGVPVAESHERSVAVNFTLGGATPEDVAHSAADARAAGYDCFKLKVGLPEDEARVGAVREAIGPEALLRLDANGTWTRDQAIDSIERLAPYGIEFVEQPCAALEDLAHVRRESGVAVAADESVQSAEDVETAAHAEACDVVSIKLAPMGGISAARSAIEACRACGIEPYVSSTLDGPWGIAAGLQLAAAEGISLHCGLATLELFDAAAARVLGAPENGRMAVPQGPGLGVQVDEAALQEVLVQEL